MNTQEIQTIEVDRKAVGKKLAALRDEKEMSQAAVGEALGFARAEIWNFERGIGLTLENIANLAKFYEKPIDFFID